MCVCCVLAKRSVYFSGSNSYAVCQHIGSMLNSAPGKKTEFLRVTDADWRIVCHCAMAERPLNFTRRARVIESVLNGILPVTN